MNRTKLCGIAVLAVLAGAGVYAAKATSSKPPIEPPVPVLPQPPGQPNPDPRMAQFLDCARACQDCARTCDLCTVQCARLVAEGKKEHLTTLATCADCASICASAASVTTRNGPLSDLICASCADACKRCGDACEKFGSDAIMKQCADECRRCEKACRTMLKQSPTPEK
jgi:hypothetical protein